MAQAPHASQKKELALTTEQGASQAIWILGLLGLHTWVLSWLITPLKFYITQLIAIQSTSVVVLSVLYSIQLFLLFRSAGQSILTLEPGNDTRSSIKSMLLSFLMVLFLFVITEVVSARIG